LFKFNFYFINWPVYLIKRTKKPYGTPTIRFPPKAQAPKACAIYMTQARFYDARFLLLF